VSRISLIPKARLFPQLTPCFQVTLWSLCHSFRGPKSLTDSQEISRVQSDWLHNLGKLLDFSTYTLPSEQCSRHETENTRGIQGKCLISEVHVLLVQLLNVLSLAENTSYSVYQQVGLFIPLPSHNPILLSVASQTLNPSQPKI
jgi:hypothetical protein